jgi:hypothetical protein
MTKAVLKVFEHKFFLSLQCINFGATQLNPKRGEPYAALDMLNLVNHPINRLLHQFIQGNLT